jgi:hypothetical protein
MATFPCVSVAVFDEAQRPHPPEKDLTGKEIEMIVDEDINRFEAYFAQLGDPDLGLNERLHPMERAAIKTWLHWKLFVEGR